MEVTTYVYKLHDVFSLSPADECEDGVNNCDTNAACIDTNGNYTCHCNAGYSGDGVTCVGKYHRKLKTKI